MPLTFPCPTCRSTLQMPDDAAGKLVRCGGCRGTLRVPEPAPPPRPAPRTPPRRPPAKAGRGPAFWLAVALLGLGFLAGLGSGAYAYFSKPRWRTHESAGGFTVDLPAAPRTDLPAMAAARERGDALSLEGTRLWARGEEYAVVYVDIPAPQRQAKTDAALLADMVAGLGAHSPDGTITRDDPVDVSGCPGREVEYRSARSGNMLGRIVLADTRAYTVLVSGRGADPQNERFRRFVDSFAVTDPRLLAAVGRRAATARRQEEAARRPDPALVAADKLLADAFANAPCPISSTPRSSEVPDAEVTLDFGWLTGGVAFVGASTHLGGRGQTGSVSAPGGTRPGAGPHGRAVYLPNTMGFEVRLRHANPRPAVSVGGWMNVRTGPIELFGTDRRDSTAALRLGVAGGRLVGRYPTDGHTSPGEPAAGIVSHPWPESGWHHVALVDETTATGRTVTLYLDGAAVRTDAPPRFDFTWPAYPHTVFFGASPLRLPASEGTPDGKGGGVPPLVFEDVEYAAPIGGPIVGLDELFLFDRPLTVKEIRFMAAEGAGAVPPPPAPAANRVPPATDFKDLLFYLACDEIEGTALRETVSGKFIGKLVQAGLTDGVRGKALRVVSAGGAVDIASVGLTLDGLPLSFPPGAPVTLGFWMRVGPSSPVNHPVTVILARPDPKTPYRRTLRVSLTAAGVTPVIISGTATTSMPPLFGEPTAIPDPAAWNHFALVRDASNRVSWYRNGVSATAPGKVAAEELDWASLQLVKRDMLSNGKSQVDIDEFAVFGRALTDDELQKLAGKGAK